MSHLPFTTTGALRHSGPRRVKRTWGGTVCGVLVLLLLSALAGWLLHCVRHAALPMAVRIPGLAVVPWVEGSVVGLLGFGSMVVIWKVALWIKRRDDEAMARWAVAESREDPEDAEDLASPSPWVDPLALPYIGMKQEDLLRILASLIVECCMAEELVRKSLAPDAEKIKGPIYCPNCNALAGINPAAVPVRLREAMNCLHGLKVCLGKLADCAAKGAEKPATGEAAS
mgnify:CR=1 FL=1